MTDNLETYCLVWLDNKINESSPEHLIIKQQFRKIINYVKIFNNVDVCQKYIESVSKDDRLILIVNNQMSHEIIPRIHQLRHVSSIYISQNDDNNAIILKNNLSQKVRAICAQLNEVTKTLELDYHHETARRHRKIDDFISISVFNTTITVDQSSTELNGQFIYSQLLIDALLRISTNESDKNEFFTVCEKEYSGNTTSLANLEDFKQNYSSGQAFLWYTKETFIYRLLNKALRVQNIELLYLFRFFIHDLYIQLERHKCTSPIRVYRGQVMSKEELRVLQNSIGQLISMNSFLSTTFNRNLALFYLGQTNVSDELARILFEIKADPQLDGVKPFANITAQSNFPSEEEVLIMLGSIFRLESVTEQNDEGNRCVYIVRMTLCNDNNHHSKVIYEVMKKKISLFIKEDTYLLEFGILLSEMGKFKEAEKYLHRLLDQLIDDHPAKVYIYQALGEVAVGNGEHELSLQWLHKALEIRKQTLPQDHQDIGYTYKSLGISFAHKLDYKSALESYNKALKIWQCSYGDNHPEIASYLNNIAIVYQKTQRYAESLEYHQKGLHMSEKIYPVGHPHIAVSLHNIGDVYCSLDQFTVALEYYERALNLFQKSLPNHHPYIAYTLGSIGLLYENSHQFDQSLCYYQQSFDIYQQIVTSTHHGRIRVEQGLCRVTKCIDASNLTPV
jgi:tetratricopeptide (TPR) repeat protein